MNLLMSMPFLEDEDGYFFRLDEDGLYTIWLFGSKEWADDNELRFTFDEVNSGTGAMAAPDPETW
jgi:hypothetical protein